MSGSDVRIRAWRVVSYVEKSFVPSAKSGAATTRARRNTRERKGMIRSPSVGLHFAAPAHGRVGVVRVGDVALRLKPGVLGHGAVDDLRLRLFGAGAAV